VNTPDDNTSICFSGSGRYAYISALRNGDSYGNLDIYRVIFNDVQAGYTTLKAVLSERDSVNIFMSFRKDLKKNIDSLTLMTDATYRASNNISDSLYQACQKKLAIYNEKMINGPDTKIEVYNASNASLVGTYKPNRESGKFIVILNPGKYNITINCEGFQEYKETIQIDDREMPVKEIVKYFHLTSKQ